MTESNDDAWLLARERGEDITYVPAAKRARYDRLGEQIAALPDLQACPRWKQRVLDGFDDPSAGHVPPRQSRTLRPLYDLLSTARQHWTWMITGSTATTLVVVLALTLQDRRANERVSEPDDATAFVTFRRGDKEHRGSDISIGDTLVVQAQANHPIEVRVYGDIGEPLGRCTETASCIVERDGLRRRLRFELELRSAGDVRTVLFMGDLIPAAFHSLNADIDAAQEAQIETRQITVLHVR